MADPFRPAKHKTSTEEARLLIKQAGKAEIPVPNEQVECAKGGEPCGLASCHICREGLHHSAVAALHERYNTSTGRQWATMTPADGRVELDQWPRFDPTAFVEKLQRQLRETLPPGTEVYGALDVSANSRGNRDHHLQFHVHAFVHPPLDGRAQAKVRARFRRSRHNISKPVMFQWLEPEKVDVIARYTWKWFYKARSSMDAFVGDDGNRVYPKAKKPKMRRPADRVVVHAILRTMSVRDLLFMVGIKPKNFANPVQVGIMGAKRTS